MPKLTAAEKASAGLRHALLIVCTKVTGRTTDRIAQSKRGSCWSLAMVDYPQVARTCILRAILFADTMLAFSFLWRSIYFFFFLSFCIILYRFRRYAFIEAAALRSIVLRYCFLKKNQSAPRPSGHPPSGKKMSIGLGGNIGCRD